MGRDRPLVLSPLLLSGTHFSLFHVTPSSDSISSPSVFSSFLALRVPGPLTSPCLAVADQPWGRWGSRTFCLTLPASPLHTRGRSHSCSHPVSQPLYRGKQRPKEVDSCAQGYPRVSVVRIPTQAQGKSGMLCHSDLVTPAPRRPCALPSNLPHPPFLTQRILPLASQGHPVLAKSWQQAKVSALWVVAAKWAAGTPGGQGEEGEPVPSPRPTPGPLSKPAAFSASLSSWEFMVPEASRSNLSNMAWAGGRRSVSPPGP